MSGASAQDAQAYVAGATSDLRDSAGNLLDRARKAVAETRDRAVVAAEDRRIKASFGRPATRVTLDPSDSLILNDGELVTHRAVDEARNTGALDILLDRVSMNDPQLRTPDVNAETLDARGRASVDVMGDTSGLHLAGLSGNANVTLGAVGRLHQAASIQLPRFESRPLTDEGTAAEPGMQPVKPQ